MLGGLFQPLKLSTMSRIFFPIMFILRIFAPFKFPTNATYEPHKYNILARINKYSNTEPSR